MASFSRHFSVTLFKILKYKYMSDSAVIQCISSCLQNGFTAIQCECEQGFSGVSANKKGHMKKNPKIIISLKRKSSLKRRHSLGPMTYITFILVSTRSRRHKSDLTKHFLCVHSDKSPSFLIGSLVLSRPWKIVL